MAKAKKEVLFYEVRQDLLDLECSYIELKAQETLLKEQLVKVRERLDAVCLPEVLKAPEVQHQFGRLVYSCKDLWVVRQQDAARLIRNTKAGDVQVIVPGYLKFARGDQASDGRFGELFERKLSNPELRVTK